jgi:hypothetical protein
LQAIFDEVWFVGNHCVGQVLILVGLASKRIAGDLVLLLALCGVAAALWEHFKAAASSSCAMTVADNIDGLGLFVVLGAAGEWVVHHR